MIKSNLRRGVLSTAVAACVLASGIGMAGVASAANNFPLGNVQQDGNADFATTVKTTTVTRLAGNDRISTAIVAAQSRAWGTNKDVNVVIARYDDFADALSAGPLADALDAPILVTNSNVLDTRVKNELVALGLNKNGKARNVNVIIVGGQGAISTGVATDIDAATGSTSFRIQGSDRYETSVNVSKQTIDVYSTTPGAKKVVNVFLATGRDFADAMTAGSAAASNNGVVILTADTVVPAQTQRFLDRLVNTLPAGYDLASIVTVGGQAEAAAEDADAHYTGSDRYETAALLADHYFDFSGNLSSPNTQNVAIASGHTYADAVVAAGYIANADGPLLLSNPNVLNGFTKSYLEKNEIAINRAFVFGGQATLSLDVTAQVKSALAW
ncbi:cell wall-binding repeat-containing protein [Arthrobacter sp. E3]|uniref:cell wall-binding repeat-containing protein n=1 Tax=Arthrobacter sp. E3 TaxID=517402 RepID=UPI001A948BAA|nr:cell wall-binding repeat-containing protein [Arthrobacter sp. E3]